MSANDQSMLFKSRTRPKSSTSVMRMRWMSTGPKYSRLYVSDVLSDSPLTTPYAPAVLSCCRMLRRAMMLGAMTDDPYA